MNEYEKSYKINEAVKKIVSGNLSEGANSDGEEFNPGNINADTAKEILRNFIRIGWLMDKGHLPELLDSLSKADLQKALREINQTNAYNKTRGDLEKLVKTMVDNFDAFIHFADAADKIEKFVTDKRWK